MRIKPTSVTIDGTDLTPYITMVELDNGERTWQPSPEWLAEALRDALNQCAPALGVHQYCGHDPRGRTA